MEVPRAHFTISVRLFRRISFSLYTSLDMLSNYSIHYQNLTWDSK